MTDRCSCCPLMWPLKTTLKYFSLLTWSNNMSYKPAVFLQYVTSIAFFFLDFHSCLTAQFSHMMSMINSNVRSSLFIIFKVHVIIDWKQNILGIFQSWLPTSKWITSSVDIWFVSLSLMILSVSSFVKVKIIWCFYDSERNIFGLRAKLDFWGCRLGF